MGSITPEETGEFDDCCHLNELGLPIEYTALKVKFMLWVTFDILFRFLYINFVSVLHLS